jgi:hypothetical protein
MSSPVSDTTSINLTRILSRLERTILSADSDPQIRKSSFERAKASAVRKTLSCGDGAWTAWGTIDIPFPPGLIARLKLCAVLIETSES